jgi:23S rRNA (guanine745-N1)-methyltransferase
MDQELILTCPVCQNHLKRDGQTLKCIKNHQFDVAKEQYVNLYHNKNRNAGDDKEMLIARKHILDQGYYEAISDQLNDEVSQLIQNIPQDPIHIVDAGCGEGYYLDRLQQHLANHSQSISYYGFDISKKAIQLAAKRNPSINWFVANANTIPLETGQIELFINMFSYYSVKEIDRLLSKSGKAIIFRAGKTHLLELKEVLYDELTLKESQIESEAIEFKEIKEINFKSKVLIKSQEDLQQLLLMTPHYWKTKHENKLNLLKLTELNVTLDIDIYFLSR